MAVKTPFVQHDFEIMLAQYDLGDFVSFQPFEQGQDQTNALVTTTKIQAALRYYESRTLDYASFEIELLHHLAKYSYPIADPYPKRNGEYVSLYNNKPFAIFKFLEGRHNDNPNNYLQIAEAIAQLHTLTEDYQPTAIDGRPSYNQEYILSWATKSAKNIHSEAEAQTRLDWTRRQLDSLELPDSLPKGVCHGDTNPTNFLYQDGRLSAVLDFDQANYTWLIFDVAELIYWWTWPDKGVMDFAKTKELVKSYEQKRILNDNERGHLFDALKFVLLIGTGWFLHNDNGYKNNVRKVTLLDEVGREKFSSRIFE
jgi:homoserine kinase type II